MEEEERGVRKQRTPAEEKEELNGRSAKRKRKEPNPGRTLRPVFVTGLRRVEIKAVLRPAVD